MQNSFNYAGPVGELNSAPSQTVPDMSISLRELLNRHNSGGSVKTFSPVDVPEGSMIPIALERYSPTERAELAMQVADFIATTRGGIISARQAADRAAYDARVSAAAAALVAAKVD